MRCSNFMVCTLTIFLLGCTQQPKTPREEAVAAQEELAEAREEAAEMIADSEEEAVEIISEARSEAKQEVSSSKRQANQLVDEAEQELGEKLEDLSSTEVIDTANKDGEAKADSQNP